MMHAETQEQLAYVSELREALASSAAATVTLARQNSYMRHGFPVAALSAPEELQILQVDEFEVRRLAGGYPVQPYLRSFAWQDDDDLKNRQRHGVSVVPYYENFSLLAHRTEGEDRFPLDWEELARRCRDWEAEHPTGVYFDYPRGTGENFNCLFFEILQATEDPPLEDGGCALTRWLSTDSATRAALVYRTLARRAFLADPTGGMPDGYGVGYRILSLDGSARVWRLWFSTLSTLAAAIPREEHIGIAVTALPGNVSTVGSWYLGVPSHSAAPEAALSIIRNLTTPEAQLERLRRGIGLPTERGLYAPHPSDRLGLHFQVAPQLVLDLRAGAFRRSRFECYHHVTQIVDHHLREILSVPNRSEDEVRADVSEIMGRLEDSIALVHSAGGFCKGRG